MKVPLLCLILLHKVLANCHLHRPTEFLRCYSTETSSFWLYSIIFILIFFATFLGLQIYGCLHLGWMHPPNNLPRFPGFLLQPLPPPPAPVQRAPSVISYFHLNSEDV